MITVSDDSARHGVRVVEACRPPVDEVSASQFSVSELGWVFATLKYNRTEDAFEQALQYISQERREIRARTGPVK